MSKTFNANEAKASWDGYIEEFHELWKEMGQPHPNSNKYLMLNRVFFFEKGMEMGAQLNKEAENAT